MLRLVLIFAGGGCGSVLRYFVGGWGQKLTAGSFPLGTLIVNILGCLLIGFLATLFNGPVLIRNEYRLAIIVGVLGGFTTFSSFSWETITLANDGQFVLALANVLVSITLGLAAAWLGSRCALMMYGTA
jgi:CrcB protein